PTLSRSLCLPPARTHFCAVTAREYGRFSRPVKTFLNCTIPALVNIRVGSLRGTSDEDDTTWGSLRAKKSRKFLRISLTPLLSEPREPLCLRMTVSQNRRHASPTRV